MEQAPFVIMAKTPSGKYLLYNTATAAFARVSPEVYACWEASGKGEVSPAVALSPKSQRAVALDSETQSPKIQSAEAQISMAQGARNQNPKARSARPQAFDTCGPEILSAETQLQDAGFLVEDAARLRQAHYQAFQAQREQTDMLSLSIAPTYACNCRCPYCYESDKAAPWTFMSEEVEQALYAFVKERFAAMQFGALDVQWYGGDPQLCLDQVERISQHLWDFCQERQLAYTCMMLTNATRIGAAEASRIAAAHVQSALITLDGPEEQHDYRRPTVEGGNPYQKVLAAIGYLQGEGVRCDVVCNSDKINLPLLPRLQQDLDPFGVAVTAVKLNDYSQTYQGCNRAQGEDRLYAGSACGGSHSAGNDCDKVRFAWPHFDLFTHEEFHQAHHDLMKSQGQLTKESLRALLQPCCNFCKGQTNHYYIIDNVGDVYKCDGRMGDPRYRLFNLLDGSQPALDAVSFNPCEDQQCANCALLPLCWGNCSWERQSCGMPCHPLMTVGDQYLNDYADWFPEEDEPFELLAAGDNCL